MVPHIDFLPASYHLQRQSQQKKLWRRSLLVVFLGLIVIGTLGLKHTHSELRGQRDSLQASARAMQAKLEDGGKLRQTIARSEAEANVVSLLRVNPAPTRILAVVTECLPQFVTLTELRLSQQKIGSDSRGPARPSDPASAEKTGAELDLDRLRKSAVENKVVVSLTGLAPDDIAISKYLAALHATGLFSDAQLLYTDQQQIGEYWLRSFAMQLSLRRPQLAPAQSADPAASPEVPVGPVAAQPVDLASQYGGHFGKAVR